MSIDEKGLLAAVETYADRINLYQDDAVDDMRAALEAYEAAKKAQQPVFVAHNIEEANAYIDKLTAEATEQPDDWREREEGKRAIQFLQMQGYRRCDMAACNCPFWHGGNAGERLTELHELMSESGFQPYAKTIYKALEDLIIEHQQLKEASTKRESAQSVGLSPQAQGVEDIRPLVLGVLKMTEKCHLFSDAELFCIAHEATVHAVAHALRQPMRELVEVDNAGIIAALLRYVDFKGSQKVAAEMLNISPQYLCDILQGRREVSEVFAGKLGYDKKVVYRVHENARRG